MLEVDEAEFSRREFEMTPREQLVQEVMQAPDFLVSVLIKLLRLVREGKVGIAHKLAQFADSIDPEQMSEETLSAEEVPKLIRKGSALVVGSDLPPDFDVNQWISDLREARIQEQMEI